MANVRLNIFENSPLIGRLFGNNANLATLMIHGVYVPGSISLNNIAVLLSQGNTTQKTVSISFGLYSLNGSTLSLANSASQTQTNYSATGISWLTFVTSANQDITPGNWYLAFLSSTSSNNNIAMLVNAGKGIAAAYSNIFARGYFSVSTNGIPSSIATTDMIKEDTSDDNTFQLYPYVLISA